MNLRAWIKSLAERPGLQIVIAGVLLAVAFPNRSSGAIGLTIIAGALGVGVALAWPKLPDKYRTPPADITSLLVISVVVAAGIATFWDTLTISPDWPMGDWGPQHAVLANIQKSLPGFDVPVWNHALSTGDAPLELYPSLAYFVTGHFAAVAGLEGDLAYALMIVAVVVHVLIAAATAAIAMQVAPKPIALVIGLVALVDSGAIAHGGTVGLFRWALFHSAMALAFATFAALFVLAAIRRPRLRSSIGVWIFTALACIAHPAGLIAAGASVLALVAVALLASDIPPRRALVAIGHLAIGVLLGAAVWMPLAERILTYGQHFPNAIRSPARLLEDLLAAASPVTSYAFIGYAGFFGIIAGLWSRKAVTRLRRDERARSHARPVRRGVPRVRSRARPRRRAPRHRAPRAARATVHRGVRRVRHRRHHSRRARGVGHRESAPAPRRRRTPRHPVGRTAPRCTDAVVGRVRSRPARHEGIRLRSRGPRSAHRVGADEGRHDRSDIVGARRVRDRHARAHASHRGDRSADVPQQLAPRSAPARAHRGSLRGEPPSLQRALGDRREQIARARRPRDGAHARHVSHPRDQRLGRQVRAHRERHRRCPRAAPRRSRRRDRSHRCNRARPRRARHRLLSTLARDSRERCTRACLRATHDRRRSSPRRRRVGRARQDHLHRRWPAPLRRQGPPVDDPRRARRDRGHRRVESTPRPHSRASPHRARASSRVAVSRSRRPHRGPTRAPRARHARLHPARQRDQGARARHRPALDIARRGASPRHRVADLRLRAHRGRLLLQRPALRARRHGLVAQRRCAELGLQHAGTRRRSRAPRRRASRVRMRANLAGTYWTATSADSASVTFDGDTRTITRAVETYADTGEHEVTITAQITSITQWTFTFVREDTLLPPRDYLVAPPAAAPSEIRAIR